MANGSRKLLIKLLLLMLICMIVAYISVFLIAGSDIRPVIMSESEGYYTIDPDTILEDLAQGKNNVFTPQIATPEVSSLTSDTPVQWTQADYYRIAQALHEFVWSEPIEGWSLEKMLYKLDCSDVSSGPQLAHFKYFQIVHNREEESRFMHDIWIQPNENTIIWRDVEKYPNAWDKRSIALEKLKISAEDALRVAEKNGGSGARIDVENDCIVYLSLVAGANRNRWHVSYSGESDSDLPDIYIDPVTGKYDIQHP